MTNANIFLLVPSVGRAGNLWWSLKDLVPEAFEERVGKHVYAKFE